MMAKQTRMSASLVVLLSIPSVPAFAEPDETAVQPAGEVRDEEDVHGEAPGMVDPVADPPRLEKPPTGWFSVGIGFAPDENFIASAAVGQDNLFGTGHKLELEAKVSARQQQVLASYEDPHLLGSRLRLRGELHAGEQQFVGFDRKAAGAALTLTAPLGPHVEGFIGYRIEEVSTTLVPAEPFAFQSIGGSGGENLPSSMGGRIASLRAGLAYSTLDAPVLPRRGTSIGASIEVADELLGSAFQKTRLDGWANIHRPLGPLTLHLGGTVSSVSSTDPWGVLLSERLQFAGSSAVRGYAPGSVGPYDPFSGRSLGGNVAYTARGEIEVPLFPRYGISAVGFVDAGGIYDRSGRGGMGLSAGVGLIWRSPIGPIRLDWALPAGGDGKPHFLFSLGNSF